MYFWKLKNSLDLFVAMSGSIRSLVSFTGFPRRCTWLLAAFSCTSNWAFWKNVNNVLTQTFEELCFQQKFRLSRSQFENLLYCTFSRYVTTKASLWLVNKVWIFTCLDFSTQASFRATWTAQSAPKDCLSHLCFDFTYKSLALDALFTSGVNAQLIYQLRSDK